MKLLKQVGIVFPITQHTYLVVFFISASFTIIGMKSDLCTLSVLLVYTATGMGRCIYCLFHSWFL